MGIDEYLRATIKAIRDADTLDDLRAIEVGIDWLDDETFASTAARQVTRSALAVRASAIASEIARGDA